ncbi:MAG: aldo/keto reductase, partial [Planctomycetota bacterium]
MAVRNSIGLKYILNRLLDNLLYLKKFIIVNKCITRRKFIKHTVGATAALSLGTDLVFGSQGKTAFNPKGLPTRRLGKTGIDIPLMIIGTGSRFMSVENADKGLEILEYALDHGLFYWDTAATYKNDKEYSEERLGKLLKTRRREVFLATKVVERDAEGAKRTIEQSLKRLQTDYIDLYQVHSIRSVEDAEKLGEKGAVLELLKDYQRQGVIKHIGFTGHTSAEGMKRAAEKYDFDTMLIAMNHLRKGAQRFEEQAVPAAGKSGMGVLAMKVIRPRQYIGGLDPKELIRYSLAVVGIDSMSVLKTNLEVIKNFRPLPRKRMKELNIALTPFYQHKNLVWMQPDY